MAVITYNAGTDTITVTGPTANLFTDIFNADVAGAWGQVTRLCLNMFCFDCYLQIGDGTIVTVVSDTHKHVLFRDGVITGVGQYLIRVRTNATATFGLLTDLADKLGEHGCHFISLESTFNHSLFRVDGTLYGYHCSLVSTDRWTTIITYAGSATRLYNCLADGVQIYGQNFDLYDLTVNGGPATTLLRLLGANTINEILLHDGSYAIDIRGAVSMTARNVTVRNMGISMVYCFNTTAFSYLINTDTDGWTFTWAGVCTGRVYRQNDFDLTVRDKLTGAAVAGATVTLWDNVGGLVFQVLTNAAGQIVAQTVTHGYFDQANGNVEQLSAPFHLRIEAAGFKDYDDYNLPLANPTELEIGLNRHVDIIFVDRKPVLNLSERDPDNELYRNIM